MEKNTQITSTQNPKQEDVIKAIDHAQTVLTTAWCRDTVTDEYREAVGEALAKAFKVAVQSHWMNRH